MGSAPVRLGSGVHGPPLLFVDTGRGDAVEAFLKSHLSEQFPVWSFRLLAPSVATVPRDAALVATAIEGCCGAAKAGMVAVGAEGARVAFAVLARAPALVSHVLAVLPGSPERGGWFERLLSRGRRPSRDAIAASRAHGAEMDLFLAEGDRASTHRWKRLSRGAPGYVHLHEVPSYLDPRALARRASDLIAARSDARPFALGRYAG